MISGNFLENLFKVKTSFFVFFILFVITVTYCNPNENSNWFWLEPSNLFGNYNKENHILSILFLFSGLKIVVRFWDWVTSLSGYGKMYAEIIKENNALSLVEIGIQKLLIDFIEFNHSGFVRLQRENKVNKIIINIRNYPHFECVVRNSNIIGIFTQYANKPTHSNFYEVKINDLSSPEDPNVIKPEFKNKIMELKEQLKNSDCKIYSFLTTEYVGNLLFKLVCYFKSKFQRESKK